jgi:hypothetical protein
MVGEGCGWMGDEGEWREMGRMCLEGAGWGGEDGEEVVGRGL